MYRDSIQLRRKCNVSIRGPLTPPSLLDHYFDTNPHIHFLCPWMKLTRDLYLLVLAAVLFFPATFTDPTACHLRCTLNQSPQSWHSDSASAPLWPVKRILQKLWLVGSSGVQRVSILKSPQQSTRGIVGYSTPSITFSCLRLCIRRGNTIAAGRRITPSRARKVIRSIPSTSVLVAARKLSLLVSYAVLKSHKSWSDTNYRTA